MKVSAVYPKGTLSLLFAFKTQMIYEFCRILLSEKYLYTLHEICIKAFQFKTYH